ncbi:ATP-binding cassette domain-containing protein [Staphylococcus chromogenes]|nr:ATP-binding cassette domain-containing protein [Staphylococcus chromogenes]
MHARCSYGHHLPLGDIDQQFFPGHMYALSGPNGSGKSTLLLTLAGELEPVEGEVTCAEGAKVIRIGDPVFYPDLNVREHFELLKLDTSKLEEEWVLEDLLDHPPIWLSSGQRQRVFLASQLGLEADVLLIDEPERHLDSDWIDFLIEQLRGKTSRAAVIVATHNQAVLDACDQVIQL